MSFLQVLKLVKRLVSLRGVYVALVAAAERFKAALADGKLTDDEVREVVASLVDVVLAGKGALVGEDRS